MEAAMATVTAAPTPARTAATLVTAPAIAHLPTDTAAIMEATTAATAVTTGVTAATTAVITINSETDQAHRIGPRLENTPVFPPAIVAVICRRSGGMRWMIGNTRSRSQPSGSRSDWKNGVVQRVANW